MVRKQGVCAFCGRKGSQVRLMIQGIDAEICDDCAEQAHAIVIEQFGNEERGFNVDSTGTALKRC